MIQRIALINEKAVSKRAMRYTPSRNEKQKQQVVARGQHVSGSATGYVMSIYQFAANHLLDICKCFVVNALQE